MHEGVTVTLSGCTQRWVCPAPEELNVGVERNVPCPVSGCGRTFTHSSALRTHVVKSHRIVKSESDLAILHGRKLVKTDEHNVVYHCPGEDCNYNPGKKTFTEIKYLKQHYMKRHAEKKFKCSKCDSGFGLDRDRRGHERQCGQTFTCDSCNVFYSTRENLRIHCRAKEHPMPGRYKIDIKKKPREPGVVCLKSARMVDALCIPAVAAARAVEGDSLRTSEGESIASSSEEDDYRKDETNIKIQTSHSSCMHSCDGNQRSCDPPHHCDSRPPTSAPRARHGGQSFILPRPTAIVMPMELKLNAPGVGVAQPTGKLILVSGVSSAAQPPRLTSGAVRKRPKPLAPKPTQEMHTQTGVRDGSRPATISIGTQTPGSVWSRRRRVVAGTQTASPAAARQPTTNKHTSKSTAVQMSARGCLKRGSLSTPAQMKRSRALAGDDLEFALIDAAYASDNPESAAAAAAAAGYLQQDMLQPDTDSTMHSQTQTITGWEPQTTEQSTSQTQTLSLLSDSALGALSMSHSETQTLALWDEIQGALNESISTQTLESFIAGFAQVPGVDASSQVWFDPAELDFAELSSSTVSVQTGSQSQPQNTSMSIQTENAGMSVQTDTSGLLDLALLTQGTQTKRTAVDTSVLSGCASIGIQAMSVCHAEQQIQTTLSPRRSSVCCGPDLPRTGTTEQSIQTPGIVGAPAVETQTSLDDIDLPEFLTQASQTPALNNTEDMQTQTMDEMVERILCDMASSTSPQAQITHQNNYSSSDCGHFVYKESHKKQDFFQNIVTSRQCSTSTSQQPREESMQCDNTDVPCTEMTVGDDEPLMDSDAMQALPGMEPTPLFPNFISGAPKTL